MASRYHEIYAQWKADPEGFWAEAAEGDRLVSRRGTRCSTRRPASTAAGSPAPSRNTCFNCVDRHVEGGRADQAALIYDSPITGAKRSFTYAELKAEVRGARRGACRPKASPRATASSSTCRWCREAVFAMLACARIGAVHSVVFGGFAAKELATRIDDAQPKLIISASCGIEPGRVVAYKPLLDRADRTGAPQAASAASSCSATSSAAS